MTDICLSKTEIESITHRKLFKHQARALNSMGIDHKIRPDGSVMVLRSNVTPAANKTRKAAAPNFEALQHVS